MALPFSMLGRQYRTEELIVSGVKLIKHLFVRVCVYGPLPCGGRPFLAKKRTGHCSPGKTAILIFKKKNLSQWQHTALLLWHELL